MSRVKLFLRFSLSISPGTDSKVSVLFKFTAPIRVAIITGVMKPYRVVRSSPY